MRNIIRQAICRFLKTANMMWRSGSSDRYMVLTRINYSRLFGFIQILTTVSSLLGLSLWITMKCSSQDRVMAKAVETATKKFVKLRCLSAARTPWTAARTSSKLSRTPPRRSSLPPRTRYSNKWTNSKPPQIWTTWTWRIHSRTSKACLALCHRQRWTIPNKCRSWRIHAQRAWKKARRKWPHISITLWIRRRKVGRVGQVGRAKASRNTDDCIKIMGRYPRLCQGHALWNTHPRLNFPRKT